MPLRGGTLFSTIESHHFVQGLAQVTLLEYYWCKEGINEATQIAVCIVVKRSGSGVTQIQVCI